MREPDASAWKSPTMEPTDNDVIDLRHYIAVLARRRWILLSTTAIAAILGLLYGILAPVLYESEAVIQLSEQSDPAYASGPAAIQVLTSAGFLREVAQGAGITDPPRRLRRLILVSLIRDARMIRVRVRYQQPQQADKIAGVLVRRFLSQATARVTQREKVITDRLKEIDRQLEATDQLLALSRDVLLRLQRGRGPTGRDEGVATSFALNAASISLSRRDSLQQARTDLRGQLLALETPALVEPPATDLNPVAPRRVLTLTLAATFGLVCGSVFAFVVEYFRLTPVTRPAGAPDLAAVDPGRPGV